jgi:hypothetical protein
VIDAPVFSLMNIAFVRQNSSYGLIIKVIPSVLKVLFSLLKLIGDVVSGTLLIHTKIFLLIIIMKTILLIQMELLLLLTRMMSFV